MYTIKLTEVAAETLNSLEATARRQIIQKIEQLKNDPALLGKPLVGPLKEYRSVRAAGQRYRIIYRIEEKHVIVIVVAVGIRKTGDKKDIYELMKKLVKTGIVERDG
jgi:mRNA interferase RelE/StbE